MGTILVYPSSTAEAAEVKAYLSARHIRIEELEPDETDAEILESLRESEQEVKAMMRGDIPKGKDLREILKEMKAERQNGQLATA